MARQMLDAETYYGSVPADATPNDCVLMWADLLQTCDEFLLAGLRREIGPDGDLQAAHRAWYAKEMERHDEMILHLIEEFNRRAKPTNS